MSCYFKLALRHEYFATLLIITWFLGLISWCLHLDSYNYIHFFLSTNLKIFSCVFTWIFSVAYFYLIFLCNSLLLSTFSKFIFYYFINYVLFSVNNLFLCVLYIIICLILFDDQSVKFAIKSFLFLFICQLLLVYSLLYNVLILKLREQFPSLFSDKIF